MIDIRVTHSRQVSDCLHRSTSSFPVATFFALKNFSLLNYSLFRYLIADIVYVPTLNQQLLNVYSVSKILGYVSPIASVNTIIYFNIIRDLASLEYGNVLFSTCAILFFFLSPLYLRLPSVEL